MSVYWPGFAYKVSVGGVIYAASKISIRGTAMDLDVTTTEGAAGNVAIAALTVGVAARIGGIQEIELRITNATFDSSANPFAAPYNFVLGGYIAPLRAWKNTRAGVSWQAPSALIVELSDEADVRGLQPTTFVVRTDGSFLLPAA